ncbi:MAG: hypothetical protein IKT82_04125 [Bacteroidaceae bacterium]|nr:hypothetical protein [Bacteroidaceae bacterium]
MGLLNSLLKMLGVETAKTFSQVIKKTPENRAALADQRREAHYIDLAEDQYDEDRVLGGDDDDDDWKDEELNEEELEDEEWDDEEDDDDDAEVDRELDEEDLESDLEDKMEDLRDDAEGLLDEFGAFEVVDRLSGGRVSNFMDRLTAPQNRGAYDENDVDDEGDIDDLDDVDDDFDDGGENYDGYDYGSNYRHKWDEVNVKRSWGNSFGTDAHNRKSDGYDGFDDEDYL